MSAAVHLFGALFRAPLAVVRRVLIHFPKMAHSRTASSKDTVTVCFEAMLCLVADKHHNNMETAEQARASSL